jgi:hypothetical protein
MIQHATASATSVSRPDGTARRGSGDGTFLALLTSRAGAPGVSREAAAGDGRHDAAADTVSRRDDGAGRAVTAEAPVASDPERSTSGTSDAWQLVARTLGAALTDAARSAAPTDTADLEDLDALAALGAVLVADTEGGDVVSPAPVEAPSLPVDATVEDLSQQRPAAGPTAVGALADGAPRAAGSSSGHGGGQDLALDASPAAGTSRPAAPADGAARHLDGLEVDEALPVPTAPRDGASIGARGEVARASDPSGTQAAEELAVTPLLEATPTDRSAGARSEGTAALTSTTLTRLLDAIERLEQAPPPRQLTIELGEVRVRLALEDGALRLQLLGDQRDGDRALLREAVEALAARGFDLHPDDEGGHGAGPPAQGSTEQGSGTPRPRAAARTAARLPAAGLHL